MLAHFSRLLNFSAKPQQIKDAKRASHHLLCGICFTHTYGLPRRLAWIAAFFDEGFPLSNMDWHVEPQKQSCHPTFRRQRLNHCANQSEMIFPSLFSRMKEKSGIPGFRVGGSNIAALKTIAPITGNTKIIRISSAAVFLGDDMVKLERQQSVGDSHPAVFTTVPCALDNLAAEFGRDASHA
jgi:hypothetical protein